VLGLVLNTKRNILFQYVLHVGQSVRYMEII